MAWVWGGCGAVIPARVGPRDRGGTQSAPLRLLFLTLFADFGRAKKSKRLSFRFAHIDRMTGPSTLFCIVSSAGSQPESLAPDLERRPGLHACRRRRR